MQTRSWLLLGATIIASASVPLTVYAQSVATYDGTYRGVSMQASGGDNACVAPGPVPPTLTIRNGAVQWGSGNVYQGTVNAQGAVTARGSQKGVFTGKVEAGRVTGGSNYGARCTMTFVWQK
jgi:hypothetical protein